MPRRAGPRWLKGRQRWVANVGDPDANGRATEVYAPGAIRERDRAGAWRWLEEFLAARAAKIVRVDGSVASVEWVCEAYLAWAEQRKRDGKLDAGHYTNKQYHLRLLCDALGARVASALNPDLMNEFISGLQARYSVSYVDSICATCSAAFNWAARTKLLDVNPVVGFETPMVPRSPERYAERAEAAAFLRFWRTRLDRRSVGGRFDRSTILLSRMLMRTGARPGELCKLWWTDLRWDGGKSAAGHAFAKAVIPPERWKAGKVTGKPRTIYFSPILTRALRREFERPGRHPKFVFVHGRGRGGKGAGEPWQSGSVLSKKILAVRRAAIVRAAELAAAGRPLRGLELIQDQGHNRLTNYRWRHTAISTLLMMGVDVPTVAELTGTSPQMIYQVYGHLLDSHLSAAAQKLGAGRLG